MDRFLASFLGAILGCVGGLWLAPHLGSGRTTAEPGSADEATVRELKEQVAEIRRLLERPTGLAPSGSRSPGDAVASAGAGTASGTPASGGASAAPALTAEALEALAAKAAEAALDRREAREKEAAKKPEKKRLPLRDVARELSISAAQEADLRKAYQDANDRFLKLMAEPESDAETLRRELEAAKDDPGKRTALAMKSLPKMLSKLGDVISITAERDAKVRAAVGADTAKKLKAYDIEEEDPFDFGSGFAMTMGD